MKKTNILLAALLIILASCEMKEELLGKGNSAETGAVELALSIPERTQTRAVNTDDFAVTITDTENAGNIYEYPKYSEMENPILLPVGNYKITAHSAGEIATIMQDAYYSGNSSSDLIITAGITSQAEVVCKMINTQLTLTYGDDFLTAFQSWEITIDNGSDNILTFTSENKEDNSYYWYIAEHQSTQLTLNITAVNADGQTIRERKTFSKKDAMEGYDDDSDYFTGGDVLNITLGAADEDNPATENGTIGIDITVDITFDGTDDTVEIPVEDVEVPNPGEPEQPGGDEEESSDLPSMQMPSNGHIVYTINGNDQPASADVIISTPQGLKSMRVIIESGNDAFKAIIEDLTPTLDFINGVEMVGNEIIGTVLSNFLGGATVNAPAEGDTAYTFPVGAFFNLMNIYGATAPNAHSFKIFLEDNAGNKLEKELQVTINEAKE